MGIKKKAITGILIMAMCMSFTPVHTYAVENTTTADTSVSDTSSSTSDADTSVSDTSGDANSSDTSGDTSDADTSDSDADAEPSTDISDSEVDPSEADTVTDDTENQGMEHLDGSEEEILAFGVDSAPSDLKVNLLSEPFGVNRQQLRFSWVNSQQNGNESQQAFRIVISKRENDAKSGIYIYDTSWREQAASTSVEVADISNALADNELYYWQVQTRNTAGVVSSLSQPQAFTTAMGSQLASNTGIWGSTSQKVVFLRHQFALKANVEKAVLSVTATDATTSRQYVYNMYVNGKEVGLGPTRSDDSYIYYNTYDVTKYVAAGTNTIGSINYSESNGSFLCQMTVYYSDGSSEVVVNSGRDASRWSAFDGNDTYINGASSLGTTYYTARQDNLNTSKYPFGWAENGYGTSGWRSPTTNLRIASYGLVSAETTNMSRYYVSPQAVTRQSDGSYLVDMGNEIIGSLQLNVSSPGSRTIQLEYGEQLTRAGGVMYELRTGNTYQDKWTLRNGWQSVQGLGMKTFRYVLIRNADGLDLNQSTVQGVEIRQDFDDSASSFSSSNDVLNRVYNLCKYTSKETSQDLFVDTQNRERQVYEGDSLIIAMSSYSFNAASTLSRLSSRYSLNHTTWPAEYSMYNIMLEYENYMQTADTRGLEEAYQKLKNKSLVQYYNASQGLMADVTNSSVPGQKIMVDWPSSERDDYDIANAYYNTVFNAVCVGGYADMAALASVLGHSDEASYYQNLSNTIKANMLAKLYNQSTGEFYDGLTSSGQIIYHSAQSATAFPLAFGVYSDNNMAARMAQAIREDGEVKMSVYGSYFLLKGLYESGNGLLARQIMSNPDDEKGTHSWNAMMNGVHATITSEAWSESYKTNMSFAHPWGSAPASMLVQGMFGIQPTSAGYSTFDIKIQPGGVQSASVTVPTMKGTIGASYQINGDGSITANVTIPANTRNVLYLPITSSLTSLTVDGAGADYSLENGFVKMDLGPGTHQVVAYTGIQADGSEFVETDVTYDLFSSGRWQGEATNGIEYGDINGGMIESINLRIKNPSCSGNVEYASYMQSSGWQSTVQGGTISGSPNGGKRLEAFRANLTGELANNYDLYYRVYMEDEGWLGWAENGDPAGSSGYAKKLYAVQMVLVKKNAAAPGTTFGAYLSTSKTVVYRSHVQSYGWQAQTGDGGVTGTIGAAKRMEALEISLNDLPVSGGVTYSTHVQSYGWQDWKSDGQTAGTTGQKKRIEAIKIALTGEAANRYDIYYRTYVQTYGWLDWAKNGEMAGTSGMAKRMEAMQIVIVKKGNNPPGSIDKPFMMEEVAYKTHVQTYGWQSLVYNGAVSGTVGKAKRLEGITIQNCVAGVSGSVEYKTHVQTFGWEENWKRDGIMSGTVGLAKRLEAIQVRLTGQLKQQYDIYYRVHVQTYGWLDWAKNGESAGTAGLAKRLEGIQIVYVKKGASAPGATTQAFIQGGQ